VSALMRSARDVLSLSISTPQSAMILSSVPAAIAATQEAGSTSGSFSAPVPVEGTGARPGHARSIAVRSAIAADGNRDFNARRILEPQKAALPRHGSHGKCRATIKIDFDDRLSTHPRHLPS